MADEATTGPSAAPGDVDLAELKQLLQNLVKVGLANHTVTQNIFRAMIDLRNEVLQSRNLRLSGRSHPNPLNRFGRKCFSQSNEDGITLEILRRIGRLGPGAYTEFGVGNGAENNTLILAAMGWKGFWVGNETPSASIPAVSRRRRTATSRTGHTRQPARPEGRGPEGHRRHGRRRALL